MGLFTIFFIVIVCSQGGESQPFTADWLPRLPDVRSWFTPAKYIFKGEEAGHHRFPWQALISSYYPNGTLIGVCGGSLIDPQWVLTAAHCFRNDGYLGPVGKVIVNLGAHNIAEKEAFVQTFRRTDIIIHPAWRSKVIAGSHDIALVKLQRAAVINDYVNVVRLPDPLYHERETFEKEKATMSGWGYLYDNSGLSHTLQHTTGNVISNAECSTWYRTRTVSETNICVLGPTGGAICSGDSGGPLVLIEDDNKPTLIGVTSFSSRKGCDTGKPSVFTRVSSFVGWIRESMASKE